MSSLLEKVRRAIIRFAVQPNDKIVVAVSGGPDSVCLLYLLKNLPAPYRLDLHVAHLNHQFRPEAAEEAHFVEKLAGQWHLPVTIAERPVSDICKTQKLSKQAGARMVRYQFCEALAKEVDAQWIAFGHTADDQAETMLMRILRGAGGPGLGGIPEKRNHLILRPIIECSRKDIITTLQKENISYIEDPSNKQPIYLRNRIRHQLIPALEQYNPNIKNTLCREAELLQDENELIDQWMLQMIPELGIQSRQDSVSFHISALQKQHIALQRRLIRWGIKEVLHHLEGITFQHIETIRTQGLNGKNGITLQLPHGMVAIKQYSKLILRQGILSGATRISNTKRPERLLPEMTIVPSRARVDFHEWNLRLKISLTQNRSPVFSACIASFDFDTLSTPLSLRTWQAGDRFSPFGMGGLHKKIQDFFVDAKIPKENRPHIPLLSSPQGILWVVGFRTDERFRATEHTVRILTIEVEPLTTEPILNERNHGE